MTCEEIKVGESYVYSFFRVKPLPQSHPDYEDDSYSHYNHAILLCWM